MKKGIPEGTEERILAAARKVFLKKGYAAARTRDIAEESGINLALLNYYFKSKEKLFAIVMQEKMLHFMGGVFLIVNDPSTSFNEKVKLIASQYVDNLLAMPELPLFVLSEIRNHPDKMVKMLKKENVFMESVLMKQYAVLLKQKKVKKLHPVQLLANIVGLSVFPFVAAPVLTRLGNLKEEEYRELMIERKQLIPEWIASMIYIK
jgi:hypothetical protein